MTPKEHLARAVALVGNQNKLALACGGKTKPAHVYNWLNRDSKGVPGDKAIAVARATNFEVTPHQLRPDLYPNPTDGIPDELKKTA